MPLFHIIILAIVQGVSEFLPISSSGHLLLTHHLLGEQNVDMCWEQNRLLDVAVHVGTLFAVLLYFRNDIAAMFCGLMRQNKNGLHLLKNILIASLPVIIAGFLLQKFQPSFLCLVEIMAWMTLIFGIVLWFADRFDPKQKLEDLKTSHTLLIGLSQMLALIPGVSRSGITMTSARFLGLSRIDAARFSLLLSIIAISGAGALNSLTLIESGNLRFGLDILSAVILSFIFGWIAIFLMMKWLSKSSFTPFVIYRVVLGVFLLGLIYGGFI
ncbi:MAG: undecaprenyl-diphosphate phosphatase [Alphaproteobacteria bacterium]|nr:undecaprenyl-diphosphate phosphatase [Alphaproteobacteria bacterium]